MVDSVRMVDSRFIVDYSRVKVATSSSRVKTRVLWGLIVLVTNG